MRNRVLLTSLVATALLFTACGGGGGDKKTPDDTNQTPVGSKPSFTSPAAYSVVAGGRKYITLTTGENVTDGNPIYDFNITSAGNATIAKVNDFGVFLYTAPDTVGAVETIKFRAKKRGFSAVSDEHQVTFTTVDESSITAQKPLKTGADDGGFGDDRNFTRDDANNIVLDPRGRSWLDGEFITNTSSAGIPFGVLGTTFKAAKDSCDQRAGDWRLPTIDELYDTIDFSKERNSNMVADEFEYTFNGNPLGNSWADEAFGKRLYLGNNTGVITYVADDEIKAQVRCVKAEPSPEHIVYVDDDGFTHDLTTGLEWSKRSPAGDYTFVPTGEKYAQTYCASLTGDGWRLPNINELRSIVEDGTMPYSISQGVREFSSSTLYNDSNKSEEAANWGVTLRENGSIFIGAGYRSSPKYVICVRDK